MDDEALKILTDPAMTYETAVNYFRGKLTLTAKDFYAMQEKYRAAAFTVSGYTSLGVVQTFGDELTKAIDEGLSMGQFRANMDDFLTRNGYSKLQPERAENIFRTNVQTAYSVGAYAEMTDPAVMESRPYWRYDAVGDKRTRPAHQTIDGKVYPADDPIWDTWYPPNGFQCRCSVSTLSKRDAERLGLTVETEPPGGDADPLLPDKGFDHNPAKVAFDPDFEGVPAALKKAYDRRASERPANAP